jgi:hypothetical protein
LSFVIPSQAEKSLNVTGRATAVSQRPIEISLTPDR